MCEVERVTVSYVMGEMEWCMPGGSEYSDVVFTDALGNRHQETLMAVDTAMVTVYANFFGLARFDNKSVDAPFTGSVIAISFDKETGAVREAYVPDSLPNVP